MQAFFERLEALRITMDDQAFMREALALADEAGRLGEVPVGAVVVQGDRIVGRGHNRREIDQDPTAHAEMFALREAARTLGTWRLTGCRLVVTLEPCAMCAGAMVLARVDRCVFGCDDPKGGFLGTLADLSAWPGLNHGFPVIRGVLAEEASERLVSFFRELRAAKREERWPSGCRR
ncbi:MAG: tRNA adenosine(34) deaminase TadA [Myxococcota bacterium]